MAPPSASPLLMLAQGHFLGKWMLSLSAAAWPSRQDCGSVESLDARSPVFFVYGIHQLPSSAKILALQVLGLVPNYSHTDTF